MFLNKQKAFVCTRMHCLPICETNNDCGLCVLFFKLTKLYDKMNFVLLIWMLHDIINLNGSREMEDSFCRKESIKSCSVNVLRKFCNSRPVGKSL